jgi:hypothetical protein
MTKNLDAGDFVLDRSDIPGPKDRGRTRDKLADCGAYA